MSVSYQSAPSGVTLTALGGATFGSRAADGDRLTAVTSLLLSNFNDTLDLTNAAGSRPTTIMAGNGNDTLILSSNFADLIDGGGGKDVISGLVFSALVTTGSGNETVNLSSQILGAGGDVTVFGGGGTDDIILSAYASNHAEAGDGNDNIIISSGSGLENVTVFGGAGDDTIIGEGSAVAAGSFFEIDGGSGNDSFDVAVLNNVGSVVSLLGGEGDDKIVFEMVRTQGNAALGLVNGGLGNDDLTAIGTAGNDIQTTFLFDAVWGDDSLTGFLDGVDLIEFHAAGATTFADLTVSGDATQTLIAFGSDSLLISGLNVADLTAADVLFT